MNRAEIHPRDQDSNNVLRTKNIIQSLSLKYSDPSYWQVVTMLELLNEPAGYLNDHLLSTVHQYYYDGYGAARWPWAPQGSASKSGLAIAIHDAFQSLSYWNNYMTEPTFEDVFLDTHNYQVFNQDFQTWTQAQHISVSSDGMMLDSQSLEPLADGPSGHLLPGWQLCLVASLARRRRVVPRLERLCSVGQRPWPRRPYGRLVPRLVLRQLLQRLVGQLQHLVQRLQDLPSQVLRRPDPGLREQRSGLDHVDLEDRDFRGLVLPGRSRWRLDPLRPLQPPVLDPDPLWLSTTSAPHPAPHTSVLDDPPRMCGRVGKFGNLSLSCVVVELERSWRIEKYACMGSCIGRDAIGGGWTAAKGIDHGQLDTITHYFTVVHDVAELLTPYHLGPLTIPSSLLVLLLNHASPTPPFRHS